MEARQSRKRRKKKRLVHPKSQMEQVLMQRLRSVDEHMPKAIFLMNRLGELR